MSGPPPIPAVGLFGHLGACNIGNDASMEAVLRYLRTNYPDAIIDAMCPGPERVKEPVRHRGDPHALVPKYRASESPV